MTGFYLDFNPQCTVEVIKEEHHEVGWYYNFFIWQKISIFGGCCRALDYMINIKQL